jgi:hypothetical protein
MDIAGPASATGQLVAAAAQLKLAQLSVGGLYRVTVTGVYPGKAEILIGNQYLLAATPFKFQTGDVLTLKLVERSAELLRFQLALPSGAGQAQQAQTELATLLRAAVLPDTAGNREVLATLLRGAVPVTLQSVSDITQLLASLPQQAVAAFMPLYRELLERKLRVPQDVLRQMALVGRGEQPLAAALSGALEELAEQRRKSGKARTALEQSLAQVLASADNEDGTSWRELRAALLALYGSPERRLRDALLSNDNQPDEAVEEQAALVELALDDLANLAHDEELSAGMRDALAALQALRITSSLDDAHLTLNLPLLLDGQATELQLSLTLLAEQYYQKDYALSMRLQNAVQGKVELRLRTRGPGVNVDVLAPDEAVRQAYEAELPRLVEELQEDGWVVRHAGAQVHAL